jgi:hypothetical protein
VVHVVDTDARGNGGEPSLERADDHDLAPIALAHHGIGAVFVGPERAGKDLGKLVLGLVRPVQIDHFAVKGFDLEKGRYDDDIPGVLHEGAGVRLVVDAKDAPAKVELDGMIWGDKFHRVVTSDAAFSRAAAAWVFSEDDHTELSPAEMMKVAMMGRAVSPVTSYLAVEPGTRPSTIGFDRQGFGAGRGGVSPRVMMGSASVRRIPPDPRKLFTAGIARCVAAHKPAAGWKVQLRLDTTYDEVVDVAPTATGKPTAFTSCLVEMVWAIQLPATDYNLSRERFTLDLS